MKDNEKPQASCVIDWGDGTREIFTLDQLTEKVESGEMGIKQALMMAYFNGIEDLQRACMDKSRKMSTIKPPYTYHRATGTRMIDEQAQQLKTGCMCRHK